MKCAALGILFTGVLLAASAAAARGDDAKEEAIKKEQKRFEGTWRVVSLEEGGKKESGESLHDVKVVNGPDGTWALYHEGVKIDGGTSVIDPTKTPKTIDFTMADEEGKRVPLLGIYEIGETTRKLCFAPPGKDRPNEFSTTPENEHVLIAYERVKDSTAQPRR